MNYYILLEDEAVKNPIPLQNYTKECSQHFKDIAIQENIDISTNMVDYIKKRHLFDSRHIFSDKLKEVLDDYDDIGESRAVFVSGTNKQYVYWEVKFNLIDCISNKKCGKMEKIVLYAEKIKSNFCFSIQLEKQEYLIFQFEAAERLMQTFPLGLKFKRVELTEETKREAV